MPTTKISTFVGEVLGKNENNLLPHPRRPCFLLPEITSLLIPAFSLARVRGGYLLNGKNHNKDTVWHY